MLLTRTVIHAERRVAEMDEVIKTLDSVGVDSTISQAVKHKLQLLVDANLKEYFQHQTPNHYLDVIKAVRQLSDKKPL
jgi:hypothetical protein